MKALLVIILLCPFLLFGQLENDTLWKGYGVLDTSGNRVNEKVQQVAYIKDNIIYLLGFRELLNMETGEVELKTKIDTLQIKKYSNSQFTVSLQDKTFDLINNPSKNEFIIKIREFQLPFQKITPSLFNDEKVFKTKLTGNTFYEASKDETSSTEDRLLYSPSESGQITYSKEYSSREWTSDYIIINFYDYFILKGITSPALLVTGITSDDIQFLELDYRYDAKAITWKVYDAKASKSNEKMNSKDFNLKPTKSYSKCVASLTPKQLDIEVSALTDNINTPITQVQHAYEGKWTLFSDSETRSFKKYRVKDLIAKDSSLCAIIKMPNGYYATRRKSVNDWETYLHEERIKTDSSLITKKAFPHDNSYRVFNELRNEKKTYYEQYSLDTKILREKGVYANRKEVGVWEFYDENGSLIKTINKDKM